MEDWSAVHRFGCSENRVCKKLSEADLDISIARRALAGAPLAERDDGLDHLARPHGIMNEGPNHQTTHTES